MATRNPIGRGKSNGATDDQIAQGGDITSLSGGAALNAKPTQIVFIEGDVPDAKLLAEGVGPGVKAVILDPTKDGVKQIAAYLSRTKLTNLTGIDIVAHGSDGALSLGTATLTSATLAQYSSQLAKIGAALSSTGTVQLFGCDVGENATGVAYINALSTALGGANVAAASHLVGSANGGGSWTLDVGTDTAANPFTVSTLASYNGELGTASLPVTVTDLYVFPTPSGTSPYAPVYRLAQDANGNIFGFTFGGGTYNEGVAYEITYNAPTDTYNPTPIILANIDSASGTGLTSGVVLDSNGDIFGVTGDPSGNSDPGGSVFEIKNTGGSYSYNTIYTFSSTDGPGDPFGQLSIDSNGNLYGAASKSAGNTKDGGAIYELINNSGNYTYQTLYTFQNNSSAYDPYSSLFIDSSGDIFGTCASIGNVSGNGVFELVYNSTNKTYTEKTLFVLGEQTNGVQLAGGITGDSKGDIFGFGPTGYGTDAGGGLYELVNNNGTYTSKILTTFVGSSGPSTETYIPTSAPLIDANGDLFVRTMAFGTNTPSTSPATPSGPGYGYGAIIELVCTDGVYASTPIIVGVFAPGADYGSQGAPLIANQAGDIIGTSSGYGTTLGGDIFALSGVGFATCFLRGTLISTDQGEIAVEAIQPGTRIRTLSGTFKPAIWVSQRRLIKPVMDYQPVCITAHAFGPDMPARDLHVSPDHAIFANGVLIPARALINGETVFQTPQDLVEYFHILLADHDVIFSEGLPTESLLDISDTASFDNIDTAPAEFAFLTPCAPRVTQGEAVEAVRRRLARLSLAA